MFARMHKLVCLQIYLIIALSRSEQSANNINNPNKPRHYDRYLWIVLLQYLSPLWTITLRPLQEVAPFCNSRKCHSRQQCTVHYEYCLSQRSLKCAQKVIKPGNSIIAFSNFFNAYCAATGLKMNQGALSRASGEDLTTMLCYKSWKPPNETTTMSEITLIAMCNGTIFI